MLNAMDAFLGDIEGAFTLREGPELKGISFGDQRIVHKGSVPMAIVRSLW